MAEWGGGDIPDIKRCCDMSDMTDSTPYSADTKSMQCLYESNWPDRIKDCVPKFRSIQCNVNRIDCRVFHDPKVVSKWIDNWTDLHSIGDKRADNPRNFSTVSSFFSSRKSIHDEYFDAKNNLCKLLEKDLTCDEDKHTIRSALIKFKNMLEDFDPSIVSTNPNNSLLNNNSSDVSNIKFSENDAIEFDFESEKSCLEKELKNVPGDDAKFDALIGFCNKHQFMKDMLVSKIFEKDGWWGRGKYMNFVENANTKKYTRYILNICRCYYHHFNEKRYMFLQYYHSKKIPMTPTSFKSGCSCNK